jgi:hypothetical protein
MSEADTKNLALIEGPAHVSEWRRFYRVFLSRGLVIFGMVIILGIVVTAIFAL